MCSMCFLVLGGGWYSLAFFPLEAQSSNSCLSCSVLVVRVKKKNQGLDFKREIPVICADEGHFGSSPCLPKGC